MSSDASNGEPETVSLSVQATAGLPTATARVTVISVDDVVIEVSPTLKYLLSHNGYFELYRSVYVVLEGERYEITTDALPVGYLGSGEP